MAHRRYSDVLEGNDDYDSWSDSHSTPLTSSRSSTPVQRRAIGDDFEFSGGSWTESQTSSVVRPTKKRKVSTKGQSYSREELKNILLSIWNQLSAKEAYRQFQEEFPYTTRTQLSFGQKFVAVQKELQNKIGNPHKANKSEDSLLQASPGNAYDFLKPLFISKENKFYFVVPKAHFSSVTAGHKGKKFTNLSFYNKSVGNLVRFNLSKLDDNLLDSFFGNAKISGNSTASLCFQVPPGFRVLNHYNDENFKGFELAELNFVEADDDGFNMQ